MAKIPAFLSSIPNATFITLGSYIEKLLKASNTQQLRILQIQYHVDAGYYQFLFKDSFICFPQTQPSVPTVFSQHTSLTDLIHTAISIHVQTYKFQSPSTTNLMCLGYQPSRESSCGTVRGLASVQNHYPNTLLKYLTNKWWEKLLSIVGDECVLEIFKWATIVVRHSESRNQWIQVIGSPITLLCSGGKREIEKRLALPRHLIFYSRNEREFNKKRYTNSEVLAKVAFYGNELPLGEDECGGIVWRHLCEYSSRLNKNIRKCPIKEIVNYYCPSCRKAKNNVAPIPAWKVWGIVKSLLLKLIPFSKTACMKKIINRFKLVVYLRRKETFAIEECVNERSIIEIWKLITKIDLSPQDSALFHCAREKIHHFCSWIFCQLVVPIMKSLFYITDTSCHRQKVLFYLHKDWKELTAGPSQRIISSLFDPVLPKVSCTVSRMRLIPKEDNGFRHVINFGSFGKQVGKNRETLAGRLRDVLAVLDYYRKQERHLLGSSLLGHDDTFNAYKQYTQRMKAAEVQQFYIIKLDVCKCFDTIPHDLLLNILREIVRSDYYLIQKYEVLSHENGQLKVRYKRLGFPVGCRPGLGEESGMQRLYVDKIVGKRVDRTTILRALEKHVRDNHVSCNNQVFHQKVGILQGSILSTLLCSFFYGNLDSKHLKPFMNDSGSLLMRYVDDFIFITTKSDKMDEFVRCVHQGFPEYGIRFNLEKSLANFSHSLLPSRSLLSTAQFSWCGYLIDPKDLSIGYDYSRFYNTPLTDTLSLNRLSSPLPTFKRYLQIYLKPRMHGMFLDETINTGWSKVALNIYENYVLTFAKMVCYIKDMERWKLYLFSDSIILDSIFELLSYGLRKVKRGLAPPFVYNTNIFLSIVITAARMVLERKRARYHGVLTLLNKYVKNTPSEELIFEIITQESNLINYLKF